MPKISRYNHFQPWRDGYYIAYSAISGAVALMTEDNYQVYKIIEEKFAADPNPNFTDEEAELVKQLQYGQFVCSEHLDEVKGLKFRHNLDRYSISGLGLTIAPTLACNMACDYCYEANKKGRMSAQTIEKLVEFVENRANGLLGLDVTWYGGEPLLAMDIIEDLSETFMDLGKEYKFDYKASIITNGYLLTPEITDKLLKYNIKSMQITLDGPSRIHNQRRKLKNGKPSFETIVKNMQSVADKLKIGIRVNIDKRFNREDISELLTELTDAGLRDKVGMYFGHLEAYTQVCSNIAESCYDTIEFSKIEIEFYQLLLEYGFDIFHLPSPTTTFCMAQGVNSFLIDPEGHLYRCYNHVGDHDKSMGTIGEQINYMHPRFMDFFDFTPFENENCIECKFLPICMGGCPARRIDRGLTGEQMCDSWKHNLEPMLEIIALSKQQQQMKKQQAAAAAKE